MGQIFLVRHGQASFNATNYDQLSPLGIEQAQLLAQWFSSCGVRFNRIVSGTMQRHRDTARAFLAALTPAATKIDDADFNEYDHQDVLLRHVPEGGAALRARKDRADGVELSFRSLFQLAMQRWIGGEHDDYRESWATFRGRCIGAVERLAEQAQADDNCLVFTSGGPIATICCALLQAPDRSVPTLAWELANSSITRVRFRAGRIAFSALNVIPHLDRAGRPELVTYR